MSPPRSAGRGRKGGAAAGQGRAARSGKGPRKRSWPGGSGRDVGGTLAVLLAVMAFLVAAALFPIGLLGPRIADVFPAGNPMGELGDIVNRLLLTWLGLGCAGVPVGLLAGGASVGGWWSEGSRRSLWIVTLALVVLLPFGGFLLEGGESATGWLGTAIGAPLRRTTGWLGAWVIFAAGVVVTSVTAFRFNPLRPPALGLGKVLEGARWGAIRIGTATRGWMERLTERRRAARARKEAARRAAEEKARARKVPYGNLGDLAGAESSAADADRAVAGQDATAEGAVASTGTEQPAPAVEADEGVADDGGFVPPPTGSHFEELQDDGLEDPMGGDVPTDHPRPHFGLLTAPEHENRFGMEQELDRLGAVLVNTLATFKIECEITGRTTGPAVTQYEIKPAPGVKVNRIANLEADLALAMHARSVRIVAPIPGKGAVGVEIPNPRPEIVRLREILEAPAFSRSRGALPLAMGKDLTGNPYVTDLTKMPHALIAGATGSGKSVCLNTVITSLVYRHGPDRLRMLLIDPKMVELSAYADLPHLRHAVVTDPKEAAGVLKWAVMEMERRYTMLSANGVRSLKEFNDRVEQGVELKLPEPDGPEEEPDSWKYKGGTLPWIVVVVDELADLMMTVQAEVEKPLTQLAQKARAIGIHLLVATQRPSVNVITGLIKANFPCRIAFRVASKTDSRTILDQNGADSLLGYGDMLFLPPGQSEPVRMQGAFISTEETEALMKWYREQADTLEALKERVKSDEGDILEQVRALEGEGEGVEEGTAWGDWDDLFREAAMACIQQKAGSTSLLQRRLRIGYGRAARIVDQLHDAGVLGPPDGSRPREVLIGLDTLDEICPG